MWYIELVINRQIGIGTVERRRIFTKEVIKKREIPPMPNGILIQYGNWGFNSNEDTEIKDLLDTGVKNIVEKIRSGLHKSLYLAPDKDGEIDGGFLQLECGGSEFIFL